MRYTVAEIEGRVYALLDENQEIIDERVEYADPGTALSPLIRQVLPDAARIVLCTSSLSDIDECRHLPDGLRVMHMTDDCAEMRLPDGFLRLVNIRMSDWAYGVAQPLASGGEMHMLRRAGYIRGSRRRCAPAVALRSCGDVRTLEIFGTSTGSDVSEFDYLTVPVIVDGEIDLPPGVYSAVCAKVAEMVKLILDNAN